MRIAVIGSGIAGLVCAHKLCRQSHDVVLFERQASIGVDAHSLDLNEKGAAETVRADVPSRMFNSAQWPELTELYRDVGVETVEVAASQSFSYWEGETYLSLENVIRPSRLFGKIFNQKSREILHEISRLQNEGARDLTRSQGIGSATTLEYLTSNGYGDSFIYEFLFPALSSTVFTCSFRGVGNYPAITTLQILQNLTREAPLLRARFGTQDVARRLLRSNIDLRLSADVQRIQPQLDQVQVQMADGTVETFEHLVLATQANTALQLIPSLTAEESSVLNAFCYETIPVYVHTDQRFMPKERKKWSTFNMLVANERDAAMCSVWLNRFHSEWRQMDPVFQTINAFAAPESALVLAQYELQRPVVNQNSLPAWAALEKLHQQPERRVWFCGSYAGRGTPLLESGVISATAVVNAIEKICVGAVR